MDPVKEFDLSKSTIREVNHFLHHHLQGNGAGRIEITNPDGGHAIAVGLDAPVEIHIRGHAGYYAAGMNCQAQITLYGNVGCGVAENIMSGTVWVKGNASTCAGASARGGLLVIEGSAASRCGISLKGGDIVVGGDVGHASGFMAQAGRMLVCGDAAPGLGDSLFEAVIYVRGTIGGLGADAQQEPMTEDDFAQVESLLQKAELEHDPQQFKRVGSARTLYNWNTDAEQEY